MRKVSAFLALVWLLVCSGCGGGDGDGSSAPDTDVRVSRTTTDIRFGEPTESPSGRPIIFLFTVANDGADDAKAVSAQLQLGPNLDLLQVECEPLGAGGVCPASTGSAMTIPSLPAGAILRFTVRASEQVLSSFEATASLRASAAGDRSPSNDSLTIALEIWRADLQVRYSVQPVSLSGQQVQFVATVTNAGPDIAYHVDIPTPFPDSLDVEVLDECAGACSRYGLGPEFVLGANSILTKTYTVTIPEGVTEFTSTFAATTPGETDPQDNSATATTSVQAPAP
jgi:hypothetical protein